MSGPTPGTRGTGCLLEKATMVRKSSLRLESVTAYAENERFAFPFVFFSALISSTGPWAWKICHSKHVALRDLIGLRNEGRFRGYHVL